MDFLSIVCVASVVAICYLIGMIVKASPLDDKWIPIVCGVSGAILGIIAYFIKIPEFTGIDPYLAVAKGIVSGLAATGVNQIGKQLKGKDNG